MMTTSILLTVLTAGFLRGILHALDPDHVMTVAGLSSRGNATIVRQPVRYALLWSVGHGAMIVVAAILLIRTGQHLPTAITASAESIVGLILIATGLSVLCSMKTSSRAQPVERRPSDLSAANGAPLLIGFVHGIAGSASLLALMPVALMDPAPRLAFVLVFCASVCIAMLAFALFYGRMQELIRRVSIQGLEMVRSAVGIGCIGLGAFWLLGT